MTLTGDGGKERANFMSQETNFTGKDYTAGFEAGQKQAENRLCIKLLNDTGKRRVIMALFRKAHEEQNPENTKSKNSELEAYSEGFRHCLNILDNWGDGVEAYSRVVNPSIKISLTHDDVRRLT